MMLRGKTHKMFSQESPTPVEISVLLKCASRQHTLRLDSNRFWQRTICPLCKAPVDPTRLRRIIKRFSLLFSNSTFIKNRVIPASGILALVIGVTLTVVYLRLRNVETISTNATSQPSPAVAVATPINALNPNAPSVRPSPTTSPTNSPTPLNSPEEATSATPFTFSSSVPSEVLSPSATPTPETVRYATGTNLMRPRSLNGRGVLKISNGTSSDAIAKLVDSKTNKTVRKVYIQAYSDAEIGSIGIGDYILKFALGTGYDKDNERFLYAQSFSKFDELFDFREYETNEDVKWRNFAVSLNPVVGGNAQTSRISAADFEDH